jgi:hypothetical protein
VITPAASRCFRDKLEAYPNSPFLPADPKYALLLADRVHLEHVDAELGLVVAGQSPDERRVLPGPRIAVLGEKGDIVNY